MACERGEGRGGVPFIGLADLSLVCGEGNPKGRIWGVVLETAESAVDRRRLTIVDRSYSSAS